MRHRGLFPSGPSHPNYKHGMTKTPEFSSWHAMVTRCTNPNIHDWDRYGGRGVMMSERWKVFENFLADVGPRPSLKYTLDRWPNPNGNYEPGNVRWADKSQQARNRRNTPLLTFAGLTLDYQDWATRQGITVAMIKNRLRDGWPLEKLLTTPRLRA